MYPFQTHNKQPIWPCRWSLLLGLLLFNSAQAQHPLLEEYARMGLEANLGLKQQVLTEDRAKEAIKQSRGLFMPTLSAEGRYTERYGNVINFGQILNPALAALNTLTGGNNFPTDLALSLPLKQESKLKLTQPIFNPIIYYNYKLTQTLAQGAGATTGTHKRQVVADVKNAYLNYAKANRVVGLLEKTLQMLRENLRVSERLVANDKVTADATYRARAELSDVEQQKADAEKNRDLAQQYLNYLLNRPAIAEIKMLEDSVLTSPFTTAEERTAQQALEKREEFGQLRYGLRAQNYAIKLASANYLPTLGAAVESGIQGDYYNFSKGQNYTLASVQLQWTIFSGLQNRSRTRQAKLELERLKTREQELQSQIGLQVRQAYLDAQVAYKAIRTAGNRLAAAEKSFELVEKRYAQGVINQVEYINARTSYTNAGINQILTKYDYLQKYVALERAAALYEL